MHLLKLTVVFESNSMVNSDHNTAGSNLFIMTFHAIYCNMTVLILLLKELNIVGTFSMFLLAMLHDFYFDDTHNNRIVRMVL